MWRFEHIRSAVFVMCAVVLTGGCGRKVSYTTFQLDDASSVVEGGRSNSGCRSWENYPPDSNRIRNLRMVVHFMRDGKGNGNLDSARAYAFTDELITYCNRALEAAVRPNLSDGDPLPAFPKGYRYVLHPATSDPEDKGIYFHNDDKLYYFIAYGKNTNNYNRDVIKKYEVKKDSFINLFMMPHHPDSVASPTYRPRRTGIALGSSVKVAGYYANQVPPESFAGLVNHEIGHILGLSHTWGSADGCDDTPKHSNCWNYTDEPPCDSLVSNNMMDYNAYQNALTPCQISRVSRNLTRWKSRARNFVIADWCEPTDDLVIADSIVWEQERDLTGNLIIENGGHLTVNCRLSVPNGGQITVLPGGKLTLDRCWLHTSCGGDWQGIRIGKTRKLSGIVTTIGDVTIGNTQNDDEA